jgi:hypothetical protein
MNMKIRCFSVVETPVDHVAKPKVCGKRFNIDEQYKDKPFGMCCLIGIHRVTLYIYPLSYVREKYERRFALGQGPVVPPRI